MSCPNCCKYALFCLEPCPDDCTGNCANCCEDCKECTIWLPASGRDCPYCGSKSNLPIDIKDLAAMQYFRNNPDIKQLKTYIRKTYVPPDFEAIRNEFIERTVTDFIAKNNAGKMQ